MLRLIKIGALSAATFFLITLGADSCVESTAPTALTAPRNVSVTMIAPHSAKITWTSADAPEVYYVERYYIYRDGVKIGESTTSVFTDSDLSEGVTYKYRVAAFGFELTSDLSAETATSSVTVPDVTPPTVTSTTPTNGATGQARASTITATFSEPMNASTLNAGTFSVRTSGDPVPGLVTYDTPSRTAIFKPSSQLPNATTLIATLTTGVKDAAGNALTSDFSFSFSTRDEVPPTVVSIVPPNGSVGVPTDAKIVVNFSEPVNFFANTADISLKVTATGALVQGLAFQPSPSTAVFEPFLPLATGTSYTLTVSTNVRDASGNALAATVSSSFTTTTERETTPPTVIGVIPDPGSTGFKGTPAVAFSEAMDPNTITSSTVFLEVASTGAVAPSEVFYNEISKIATLVPGPFPLRSATEYLIVVTTDVKDLSGNRLASVFSSRFTTNP